MAYPPISGRSLSRFIRVRSLVIGSYIAWLRYVRGVNLGHDVDLSLNARLQVGKRGAISIGDETALALYSAIFTTCEDGTVRPVSIGERCFIGAGAVILPGVTIGNGSIVAVGSVVRRDVPDDCIVSGNPARIVRRGIDAGWLGRLPQARINQRQMYQREAIKLGLVSPEATPTGQGAPTPD